MVVPEDAKLLVREGAAKKQAIWEVANERGGERRMIVGTGAARG